MSSLVHFTSQESNNHDDENDQLDSTQFPDQTVNSLSFPPETFLKAALALKDQVVQATWCGIEGISGRNIDPTAYSGLLGTAIMCLRSYEATSSPQDLILCAQIIDACACLASTSTSWDVTFLCGKGGVYALGAVVANMQRNQQKCGMYLDLFHEVAGEKALTVGPEEGGFGMSYNLLYGRAGFLWAALFVNSYLGQDTIPNNILMPIVKAVLAGGRAGATHNPSCPLIYRWHGTRYWGAAYGIAGVLHVLLHFPQSGEDGEDAEDVKRTLRYMIGNRFSSGNYPSTEGNPRDNLMQWSHGATSMAITLCKASQVFPHDREFRNVAIEAGEVVWKSGLVKNVGLADGVSGNAYVFLSLYRLTGEGIYEERAKAFASFLYNNAKILVSNTGNSCTSNEHDYSLFQGLAGIACLWWDLLSPQNSKFPCFLLTCLETLSFLAFS